MPFISGTLCGFFISVIFSHGGLDRDSSVSIVPANSAKLAANSRILCFVVTSPDFTKRAQFVYDTWGQRCDKILFVSSANDTKLPTVAFQLDGADSREKLWTKAKLTYRYLYNHLLDDFDWFFKADTDTYAIVENMRAMVASFDKSQPHFLGRRFQGFVSGGSGYLMTAATIRLLVEKGLDTSLCDRLSPKANGMTDDVILSVCLNKVGAVFGDTRDAQGRQRFIPFSLEDALCNKPFTYWVRGYDLYPYRTGIDGFSEQTVAFHYVKDESMMVYDFLSHRLRIGNATKVTNHSHA